MKTKLGKVLITGSMGYIGGAAAIALSNDYYVYGIDTVKHNHLMLFHDSFSLGDFAEVVTFLDLNQFDHILHFAATSDITTAERNSMACFENNISNTITLLNEIVQCEENKPVFHFASSGSILNSENPAGMNPYTLSKKVIEMILDSDLRYSDFRSVIYRFANVVGAVVDKEIIHGQAPNKPHIFSKLFECERLNKPFYINNKWYPTKDGSCVRDYIDINDLITVLKKSLEINMLQKNTFSIGTGYGTSVRECVKIFQETFNTTVKVEEREAILGDAASSIVNNSYTKSFLSWSPEYNLKDSLHNLKTWYDSDTFKYLKELNDE